jgi:hypothetical protein
MSDTDVRVEQVAKWQRRLEETFSFNGVVGGRLLPAIMRMEDLCGLQYVQSYTGHRILTDAFLDFFAITLSETTSRVSQNDWPRDMANYKTCLLFFLTLFRTMRAAEVLAVNGHALDGYALLRNAKEQVLCLGAIASAQSSFAAVLGSKGLPADRKWTAAEYEQARRNRESEERRIQDLMLGRNSGLTEDQIEELTNWGRLFNQQVHGSRFTFVDAGGWLFDPNRYLSGLYQTKPTSPST